uniref:Methyltransferase n=1 Tax=uncultured marine crenarchaeote E37-7F TaxID=907717 RepID=G9BAR0_9ARCH|nr:methyltransferase [uncultured marine crenarchaeote E37-7F]
MNALSEWTLTENARRDWNSLAEHYQIFREKPGTYNELVEVPAMLNLIGDVKEKKVLDAGCGYGFYSLLLAKKGAIVTGIDISEKNIELAKKNASECSIKCESIVCDMQDLSIFQSETFDLVTSSIVVNYLDDLKKAFLEVFRVIKLQGIFTFSENHPILKGKWETDSEGRRLHWNLDNYFERSIIIDKWRTQSGGIIETRSQHRTIQDYFDALISAGFTVERLVEPKPIETSIDSKKDRYERAKRIPYFILFKERKP